MGDPTKWIATSLAIVAASASSAVTVLDIGIDTGRRILGFADDVEIVRWEVPDGEPMFAADLGDGRVSFFRGGEEQCLDKWLGAVPCDEDMAWADDGPAHWGAGPAPQSSQPASVLLTPAPQPVPPVTVCCGSSPPVVTPPVVTPPAPVGTPASWLLGLTAVMALIGMRLASGRARNG